jgi:branched-subunit amino acid transport protein
MTAVIGFTLAATVTFLLRSTMTLSGTASTSLRVSSWIALVSPAVLTAMLASALFVDHGQPARPPIADALAIGAALLAVRRTGIVAVALAVGLPVYWIANIVGM